MQLPANHWQATRRSYGIRQPSARTVLATELQIAALLLRRLQQLRVGLGTHLREAEHAALDPGQRRLVLGDVATADQPDFGVEIVGHEERGQTRLKALGL